MTAWTYVRSTPDASWEAGKPQPTEKGQFVHLFVDADNPVNALSADVLHELRELLPQLAELQDVKALFLWSGKDEHFIAGADVDEIAAIADAGEGAKKAAEGQAIFQQVADLPFPTFAVIRGTCLGGGLELALAFDYRIAVELPTTRIGLPEVNLGIIPGFGGCQRLPRLLGLSGALPLIVGAKRLPAQVAYRKGVVDALVAPEGYQDLALRSAHKLLKVGPALAKRRRRLRGAWWVRALEANPLGRALIRRGAEKQVKKVSGGHYPAPLEAVGTVIDGYTQSLPQALELEAQRCGELIASQISKRLISIFQDSERARKLSLDENVTWPREGHVAVLGAGIMGAGIAQLLLSKNQQVRLRDLHPEALAKGLRHIGQILDGQVRRRRLTPLEREQKLSRLTHTTGLRGFAGVDVVIEAIVERLDVKQAALQEIEPHLSDTAVFATNTSALSVTEIQKVAKSPGRVVGMHFFNPVHRMPLIEVIPGRDTDPDAVATIVALAQKLGKYPVVVQDSPGFLVNRLLGPYLNVACGLLDQGLTGPEIDAAAEAFGLPMGPFRLLDEVGLDIAAEVSSTLHEAFGDRVTPSPHLERMLEKNWLGKKTGTGFYVYPEGRKATPVWNDAVQSSGSGGPADGDALAQTLVDPIVDEAARCLSEGVVSSPSDVDLAMVMGTGFPPFRGGPLRWADTEGVAKVVERLQARADLGDPRQACPFLVELAQSARKFYEGEPTPEFSNQVSS